MVQISAVSHDFRESKLSVWPSIIRICALVSMIIFARGWVLAMLPRETRLRNARDLSLSRHQRTCQKTWPDLDLFLPMDNGHYYESKVQFFRSLQFFWPLHQNVPKVTVVMDWEKQNETILEDMAEATKDFTRLSIGFHKHGSKHHHYVTGWLRQQLIKFWPDNFTDSEYVGFVDTDTFFLSPVDLEDLFENGKPIIVGGMYDKANFFWKDVPKATYHFLGLPEIMNCMSYFPAIVKTEHLISLRTEVEKHTKMHFNNAFEKIWKMNGGRISEFCVFCTYLWFFHHGEYHWYIQQSNPQQRGLKYKLATFGANYLPAELYGARTPMMYPMPRIAVHAEYMGVPGNETYLKRLLLQGYCYDKVSRYPSDPIYPMCDGIDTRRSPILMHCFECHDWTYHPRIQEAFHRRQARRKLCPHIWNQDILKDVLDNLDEIDLKPETDMCHCSYT